jgi:hypothetical protein
MAKKQRPLNHLAASPLEEELAMALYGVKDLPPAQTVDFRAMLTWRDGIPYLTQSPEKLSNDPAAAIPELFMKVLDLPYHGKNPDYAGLTNGEAMAISHATRAADGDIDSTHILLDRIAGKPSQKIQSVQLTGNLSDFLDKVAQEEFHGTTIEVPSAPPDSAEDL